MSERDATPPITAAPVHAGFPNPAEDATGRAIDLNDLLVRHPVSTYYLRVAGGAMESVGVYEGDIVVVDKSLSPRSGDVVVAGIGGEFVLKTLKTEGKQGWLVATDSTHQAIELGEASDVVVWGVVTHTIHEHRR